MIISNVIKPLSKQTLWVFFSGLLALVAADTGNAAPPREGARYVPNEVIVKYKNGKTLVESAGFHRRHGSTRIAEYKNYRFDHVKIKPGKTVPEAIKEFEADENVEYAEPNYIVHALVKPNDPYYGKLWGMTRIDAPSAWNYTTGSEGVVIATVDSGVDYNHTDLKANIWPGKGYNALTTSNDPMDDAGHGTHIAGTIGAEGNNGIGVTGVLWHVQIMACKFLDQDGYGDMAGVISCLDYVRQQKAAGENIVATNHSWGGAEYSQALRDAIDAQRDILFIAAAGNNGKDNDIIVNYPSNYDLPNVIAVAATDANDALAWFSHFGRRTVHVGAPGVGIYSTLPNNSYGSEDGSSMAAPHVAGLAGLIKAKYPDADWRAIRNLILASGDTSPSLASKTVTGRRINANAALNCTDRHVFSVLHYPRVMTVGTPAILSALSINCADPVGPVTAMLSDGETITLKDDGVSPDLAAGDGIFTAQFTPAWTSDTFFFSSPAGSESIDPAPAIVSTTPSDNATGVPISSQIKVEFNEQLNPSTITPASFSLKPGVTGTVSYDAATDTATFTPSASLVPNTIYTATISTGVTDTAGIHLAQKASWSFTTAADDGTTSPISNGTFEEGPDHWVEQSDYYIISEDSAESHAGSWFAYLGGMPNLHDKLYQDIAVPAAATSASARFWYKITTEEPMTKMYDVMKLLLVNPSTGATIKTLATLSNLDDTGNEWKLSEPFDLSAYAGKTVRLLFAATTDYSNDTGFLVDDVTVTAQISPTTGSVNINGGASLTKSRLVSLSLATTGRALRLSFNNTTWGLWAPFTPTKAITLPAGDGEKTVYVQFRGGVNNFSSSYSDTITLDTTPPVNGTLAAIQLPDNQIKLDWSNFSDATSGLAGFRLVRGTALPASCGGTPIATPGAGAATYTDTGTQGVTYFYRLCGVDKAGNVGTGAAVSARAIPEVTKPTGTVVVNNDSTYANKTAVTLAITATDASKVTAYCVSNTDKCAAWTAVKATDPLSIPARAWTLATGASGPRTVTVWFRDGWGNVSVPVSDTIILDTTTPVNGTLLATQLADNQIKLDWSNFSDATSGLAGFRLVRGTLLPASCAGTPIATPGADETTYTETGTQGATYFYRLCGVDKAGNVGTGAAVSARAIPEVTKPTGTVVVNNDSTYTTKTAVTLAITATDASKVTAYCVSNTGKCTTWTAVTPVDPLSIPARAWTLATGANGPRTVTVWFRDGWGNVSDPASDTIVLDSVAPKGTVVINSGDTSTTSQTLALTLSAQDDAAGSGVEKMSYSFNNSTWSDWEDYATSKSVTFTATATGTRYVYVRYRDKAGNIGTARDSILYSYSPYQPAKSTSYFPLSGIDGDGKVTPVRWVYLDNGGQTITYDGGIATVQKHEIVSDPVQLKIIESITASAREGGDSGVLNETATFNFLYKDGRYYSTKTEYKSDIKGTSNGQPAHATAKTTVTIQPPYLDVAIINNDLGALPEGYTLSSKATASIVDVFDGVAEPAYDMDIGGTWHIVKKYASMSVLNKTYKDVIEIKITDYFSGDYTYWVAKGVGVIKASMPVTIFNDTIVTSELKETNLSQ